MRIMTWCATALAVACAPLLSAGEAPPKLILHVPFDGNTQPAYCASPGATASHVHVAFHPGKKGQAAELGSPQYPCGLVLRAPSLCSKERGSLALWYRPSWDPADGAERNRSRMLVTDEVRAGGLGRFRLTLAGGGVHFAWRGRGVQSASAPMRNWKKQTWHHIVATWDCEKGIALFLDGERAAERGLKWRLPASDILSCSGALACFLSAISSLSAYQRDSAFIHLLPAASLRKSIPQFWTLPGYLSSQL